MLISYIRNKKNIPIGTVVAIGANIVGWSLCHKDDVFVKCEGRLLASHRAHLQEKGPVPKIVQPELDKMIKRSVKYFKD